MLQHSRKPLIPTILSVLLFNLALPTTTTVAKPLFSLASNAEWSAQQHWSPFICLSTAIYFEARSEPVEGQRAVGQVILNRVSDTAHPDTVCGVVYENTRKKHRCQFSFACDGRKEKISETHAYLVAQHVARELLACDVQCRRNQAGSDPIAMSTHYHNSQVSPAWSNVFVRTGVIGRHIFYSAKSAKPAVEKQLQKAGKN